MNKKLLQGLLVGLGIVILVLMAFPFGTIISIAFWAYLAVVVWKKQPLFNDKLEPELTEKLLKRLKKLRTIVIITFPVAIVGVILHNVVSAKTGTEEALFFFIGVIASYLFILTSALAMLTLLKGRQLLE